MTEPLDNPLTSHIGVFLNLAICSTVFLFSLVFRFLLSRSCGKRSLRYVSWAFNCWTVSWVFWIVLYGYMLYDAMNPGTSPGTTHVIVEILSNLNSATLFLAYYALTRGEALKLPLFRNICLLLPLFVLAFDLSVFFLGSTLTNSIRPDIFLYPWSVSAAMFAPFVLGRAFRHRYGTFSVWVLGCTYAVLQPFAYGTALAYPPAHEGLTLKEELEFKDLEGQYVVEQIDGTGGSPLYRYTIYGKLGSSYLDVPAKLELDHLLPDGYVIETELSRSDGTEPETFYRYRFTRESRRKRLTGRQILALSRALAEQLPLLTVLRVYLQLRLDDVVFYALVLLKLALGATVIATIQAEPTNSANVVSSYKIPKPWNNLVESWKWFYYPPLFILAALLLGSFVAYGVDVGSTQLLIAAVVSLALWIGHRLLR